MGYKVLGYIAWNGGKWYLVRRAAGKRVVRRAVPTQRDLLIVGAGVGGLLAVGAAVASRRGGED